MQTEETSETPSAAAPGDPDFRVFWQEAKAGLFLAARWTGAALALGLLIGGVSYSLLQGSKSGFLDFSGLAALLIGFVPGALLLVIGQMVTLARQSGSMPEWLQKAGLWAGALLWDALLVGMAVVLIWGTFHSQDSADPHYSRLGYLVVQGDASALRKALDQGADPDANAYDDHAGYTSLLALCLDRYAMSSIGKDRQSGMAELLFQRGADPNRIGAGRLTEDVETPAFWSAVESGDLDLVQLAAKHGAQLDTRVQNKGSILNRAGRAGFWDLTTWLLDHGCAADAEDNAGPREDDPHLGGWTLLEYAAWAGRLDIVNRLLAAGVKVEPRAAGNTALIAAACRHRVDVIKRLLAYGADPLWRGNAGTALDQAVAEMPTVDHLGSPDEDKAPPAEAMATVAALLQAGAKVDDDLMASALKHGAALSLCLLRAGGKLNGLRLTGERAVTAAGDRTLMTWLIEHGADLNLPDALGSTALGLAEARLEQARTQPYPDPIQTAREQVEWLKARGARVSATSPPVSQPSLVIQASGQPLPVAWGATAGAAPAIALAWDERKHALWSVDGQGALQRWDPDGHAGRVMAKLGPLRCACLDPAANLALAGDEGGRLTLYQLDTGDRKWQVHGHGAPVLQTLLDPSRQRAFSIDSAGTICLQNLATGRRMASRGLGNPGRIALDPSGRSLAAGPLRLDPSSLALTGLFGKPDFSATAPAGVWFLGGEQIRPEPRNRNGTAVGGYREVWVTGPNRPTILLTLAQDSPCRLAADGKGRLIASLGESVVVWDLATGKGLGSYAPGEAAVRDSALAMDAKGRFLAVSVSGGFQVLGPF